MAIALVAAIALAVFAAFLPGGQPEEGGVVQIFRDSSLIGEMPLDTDAELQVSGSYTNTIAVRGGRAAIVESDCPGRDCVHSGWIDQPGRSIACLPNRLEVRISGASEVDFVVG